MITIQIDGKTYKPAKYENNTVGKELQRMIDVGYLEEVKENKEPQPQEDIELPDFDYDKLHIEAMNHGVTFAVHVAHPLCKQVGLLTNAVNQLIKANKKL